MLLCSAIDLEEDFAEVAVVAQNEVRVGGDAGGAVALVRDRDAEPGVLALVPGHELDVRCLAERELKVAQKSEIIRWRSRNHTVRRVYTLFHPAVSESAPASAARRPKCSPSTRASALHFEAVRDQRRFGIEFDAHPLAAAVPAEVAVVEQELEAAGDLLIESTDERADVARLDVA